MFLEKCIDHIPVFIVLFKILRKDEKNCNSKLQNFCSILQLIIIEYIIFVIYSSCLG